MCVIFLFRAPKLYIEGIRHEKGKWDAAVAAAERRGAAARADAERGIAADTADKPAVATGGIGRGLAGFVPARRLRHDRLDRDDRQGAYR